MQEDHCTAFGQASSCAQEGTSYDLQPSLQGATTLSLEFSEEKPDVA